MKFAVVLLALVSAAVAAPQPRKVFHEHYEDFMDLIEREAGETLAGIAMQYVEFDEFLATLNYLTATDFKDLVYEMQAIPEFLAVVDYLESHSVDITYFIDLYNEMLEEISGYKRRTTKSQPRQEITGRDFNSYTRDVTAALPKEQLAALFDQKIAEDEEFRAAIEGIESAEFQNLLDDLLENEVFQAEVQTLEDNGIDAVLVYFQIIAVFGQDIALKH